MKNLLIILTLVTVFAFAVNAQSKDCCSKEKSGTTKVEKSTNTDQTIKTDDKVKTTTTTAALTNGKETIEKEVVMTKGDKKEKCSETSSCCTDMKKDKKTEKVEKEVEKK
jgi:hypothetical protein